ASSWPTSARPMLRWSAVPRSRISSIGIRHLQAPAVDGVRELEVRAFGVPYPDLERGEVHAEPAAVRDPLQALAGRARAALGAGDQEELARHRAHGLAIVAREAVGGMAAEASRIALGAGGEEARRVVDQGLLAGGEGGHRRGWLAEARRPGPEDDGEEDR